MKKKWFLKEILVKGKEIKNILYVSIVIYLLLSTMLTAVPVHQSRERNPGEGFWHKDYPHAIRTAWQSTVQISVIWTDLPMGKRVKPMIGTGVVLDFDPINRTALIITTNHCINLRTKRTFRFEVRIPGNKRNYKAKKAVVLMSHRQKDLVYLKVTYPRQVTPTAAVLRYTDKQTRLNGHVVSIGFPILRLRRKQNWKTEIPKNYLKTIKRFSLGNILGKGQSRDNVSILAHNADLLAGNSGGPLVDDTGKIIGINAGLFDYDGRTGKNNGRYEYAPGTNKRFYYAISTSEVLKDYQKIQDRKLWKGCQQRFLTFAAMSLKARNNR